MADTKAIFFDGVLKTCTRQPDRNGEALYVAEDGSFIKIPKGVDVDEHIAEYNRHNDKEVEHVQDVEYGLVETNRPDDAEEVEATGKR